MNPQAIAKGNMAMQILVDSGASIRNRITKSIGKAIKA